MLTEPAKRMQILTKSYTIKPHANVNIYVMDLSLPECKLWRGKFRCLLRIPPYHTIKM